MHPACGSRNLYIQAASGLTHSAPLPGPVKTRVFRDCPGFENRARHLPPRIPRLPRGALKKGAKHRFTEENTYQKPPSPGLTGNLV